jgi:predicted nucleic acid-binding protein
MDRSRRFVLDAQPVVGYFKREAERRPIEVLFQQAEAGTISLSMTTVNAGEVIYGLERAWGAAAGHETLISLQELPIVLVEVDLELAARAGWLKLRGGIAYADCAAAALAHREGIPVITGDREFHRVEDLVDVAWVESLV